MGCVVGLGPGHHHEWDSYMLCAHSLMVQWGRWSMAKLTDKHCQCQNFTVRLGLWKEVTGDVIEIMLLGGWRVAGRKWQGRACFRFRSGKASSGEVTVTETRKIRRETSHAKVSGEKVQKGRFTGTPYLWTVQPAKLFWKFFLENSSCGKNGKAPHQPHDGG